MEIRQTDTGLGTAFIGSHEDGIRNAVVHALALDQVGPMSKAVANLTARLSDFVGVVGVAEAQYKASARADHLRAATERALQGVHGSPG